jgi:hypothetical protein
MKITIATGITGTTFSFGGIYVSMQAVEMWLRLTSLTIGIVVGILTIILLIRRLIKDE